MKLGVEDISISFALPQPATGKNKFVRRSYSVAVAGSAETPRPHIHRSNSVAYAPRTNLNSKPPKTEVENEDTRTRPQSAVRFQDGHAPRSTPLSGRPRPPQSPLQSSNRSSHTPESPIHARPITPNKSIKVYGDEQRFPVTSFRQEYQSTTPIPTITRVRKEFIVQEVSIPWNRSCNPPDRETLRVNEDMAKNLRNQKIAISKNMGVRRPGSAPAGHKHKKNIPDSFSRNRNSRTSGPILNLPYSELRRNCPPAEKNIHDKRWNIQTKDRDEDERAKPEGGRDTSLHAMYQKENAYYRRNRPMTGGAINKTQEFQESCSQIFR